MTKFNKKSLFYTFMLFGVSAVGIASTGSAIISAVNSYNENSSFNKVNDSISLTDSTSTQMRQARDYIEDVAVNIDAYNRAINYTYDTVDRSTWKKESVIPFDRLAVYSYDKGIHDSNIVTYFVKDNNDKGEKEIHLRLGWPLIIDNVPSFSNCRVTYWSDSNVSGALPSLDYGFINDSGQRSGVVQKRGGAYYWDPKLIEYHNNEHRPLEGIVRIRTPSWSGIVNRDTMCQYTSSDGSSMLFRGYEWLWNGAPDFFSKSKRHTFGSWGGSQYTFAVYDGNFWSLSSRPGTIKLSLNSSFKSYNGSFYEFINNLNANNIHNFFNITAFNLPKHCIGKTAPETRITFTLDEQKQCLNAMITTPRSFVPSATLSSSDYDGELVDKEWVDQNPLTDMISIPLSMFSPRQSVTLPIDEISAENMRIFDEEGNLIFSENTYSIDAVESDTILMAIVDFVNEHPDMFFTNLPSLTEIVGRTYIEPHSSSISLTPNGNRSITFNFRFLQRTPYQNAPAVYRNGSFVITNLNSQATVANNEVDISDFRTYSYADEILASNQDLITYLRQESSIKNIFRNYPDAFISYNQRYLEIKAIESADANAGSIVVRLLAKRYAMLENGQYGDKEVTVTLYGLPTPLPPEPDSPGLKKSTYNISELNIPGLRNNLYTLDVIEDQNMLQKIENFILNNPRTFLKNTLSSIPETVPHFQGFDFSYTGEQIILNTSYLHSYKNDVATYNNTQIKFTGFNINNTILRTNYRENSESGLVIKNIDNISAYDAIRTSSYRQIVEQAIKNNIDLMFDNHPRKFVEELQNNFTLSESNTKIINGSSQMIVTLVGDYAYNDKVYTTKQFKIKVSGFKFQSETNTNVVFSYEVDKLDDTFENLKEQLITWLRQHPLEPNSSPYYFADVNDDNIINQDDFEIKFSIYGPVLKPIMIYNKSGVLSENDGEYWMYTNAVPKGSLPTEGNTNSGLSTVIGENIKNNNLWLLCIIIGASTLMGIIIAACVISTVYKKSIRDEEISTK